MKLPHVIVLSIIGMLVASLSVLVFTSPRQASQNDLTSNELEAVVEPSTTPIPRPRLMLTTELETTPSTQAPRTNSKPQEVTEQRVGWLQLTAVNEPCSFFVDGKPVQLKNDVPLFVRVGPHKIKCVHPNGDTLEKRIDVVDEAINPVFFE